LAAVTSDDLIVVVLRW